MRRDLHFVSSDGLVRSALLENGMANVRRLVLVDPKTADLGAPRGAPGGYFVIIDEATIDAPDLSRVWLSELVQSAERRLCLRHAAASMSPSAPRSSGVNFDSAEPTPEALAAWLVSRPEQRRLSGFANASAPERLPLIGSYYFDQSAGRLIDLGGATVYLSRAEISILTLLIQRAPSVVDCADLIAALGRAGDSRPNLAGVVSRLREKLGDSMTSPDYVRTSRGQGYALIAPVRMPQQQDYPAVA
jgi:DNA-binding winged helix-turn-helix (wHTH) protein